MKQLLLALVACLMTVNLSAADLNGAADNILGDYEAVQGSDAYKVRISRLDDGQYRAQLFWCTGSTDAEGRKYTDVKNPDKSLRNVPCDRIVLIDRVEYLPSRKCWGNGKIYDPQRGIKANVSLSFGEDGKLLVRGSLMGFSETVSWSRIQ